MVYYSINNLYDLIKIIKISSINNKIENNTDINYDIINKLYHSKDLQSLFKLIKKINLKIIIEEK